MSVVAPPDFAIVICTYNPEEAVFSRTLKAVEALEIPENTRIECAIVDNNSSIAIAELPYVQSFLKQCNWATVISESRQGLTFARMTGIKSTIAPIVIFIDDDNEPAANYLRSVKHCLDTYAAVAAWGPGTIKVEFLEPVSAWFDGNFRKKFQERSCKRIEYGCVSERWAEFYPHGTGLIVKREVVERYCQAIESGKLATVDRQGKSLSSAGDVQIVWEAIKLGLAAGISPDLQVTHLIPGRRATLDYVKRLTFGTASSYMPALTASFGWEKDAVSKFTPSHGQILKQIANLTLRRVLKFRYKLLVVDLAKYLGQVVGILRVVDPGDRHWVYRLVKLLSFE